MELTYLRKKIDEFTPMIIGGLIARSKFKTNFGVFEQNFYGGYSWIEYRLLEEQKIDSRFGRYEFQDQSPFLFKKEELDKPLIKRETPISEINIINIDITRQIINLYKQIIASLCEHGEDKNNYGDTTKCDVNNLLLYNERVVGVGRCVAESKIQKDPSILEPNGNLEKKLRNSKREKEVISEALRIAQVYNLNNKLVKRLFGKLIDLTVYVEVEYIKNLMPILKK